MTVHQLIEKLRQLPPDVQVAFTDPLGYVHYIEGAEQTKRWDDETIVMLDS